MGVCCYRDQRKNKTLIKKVKIIKKYPLFNKGEIDKLNSFSKEPQRNLSGNENNFNKTYNELRKYEIEQLTNEINKIYEKLIKNIESSFNPEPKEINFIEKIINNENTKNKFRNKIIQKIKEITDNKSKYEIKYLTILLAGRKNVGKTSLIKYILDSEKKGNTEIIKQDEYFSIYKNDNTPYFRFVEFKGIGYDKKSDPNIIGTNIYNYIKNHIISLKTDNYNDVVHCIWYCITGTRLDSTESQILKKLKKLYSVTEMPIIFVFTKTQDDTISNQMKEYIKEQKLDVLFVKTVAEDIKIDKNDIIKSYGKDELLQKTLEECTKSLKGGLIRLMINNLSNDLIKELKNENKINENNTKEILIDDFTKNYKDSLKDGDFIQYLIDILSKSLEKFYTDNYKISKKTHNMLNGSKFIINIKKYLKEIKLKIEKLINPIINERSKDFINTQAQKEKEYGNLDLNYKRRLIGFKNTSKIFLKKKLYFYVQKYIINYTIQNIYSIIIGNFRKILDLIVEGILNINDDANKDINSYLEYCYLTKLKSFSKELNINIEMPKQSQQNIIYEPEIGDDMELFLDNINTNSFDLGNDFNIDKEKKINNELDDMSNENKIWFPLINKNIKYASELEENSLNTYMNDIEKQKSDFIENSEDKIYNILNLNIIKDLKYFINENKKDFISNMINGSYSTKNFSCNTKIYSDLIIGQDFKFIYEEKLKKEFDLLTKNDEFTKIDYLTILIMGKSGVGKSTLVNCMLKEELAKTGVGNRVTLKDEFYKNKIIDFLHLIDTRGFELNREFSPINIYNEAIKTIDKQISDNKTENGYNNYVQCIWYCVSEGNLEGEELKLISELKQKEKYIPLIIVFTNAINVEEIDKMRKLIEDKYPGLPFVDVLGKETKRKKSYGLDNLLNKTLEKCKNVEQGNIYEKIKDIFIKEIIKIFNGKFEKIKENGYKLLIENFTQNFKQVKTTKEEIINYICNLIEIPLSEYMKENNEMMREINEESIKIFKESPDILNFLENFIIFYEKKTKEKIEPILELKAIDFLDLQVNIELEQNKSIIEENKNDKNNFIEKIQNFLNNYFFYISQKYYIYRFILDSFTPFTNEIENQISQIINSFFSLDTTNDLFKENYIKKFENFENKINEKRIDGKIYK